MFGKITREEFLDNYEYKVTKRLLKKEFPFIIDVVPTENFEDYNSVHFVYVVIDPNKFIQEHPEAEIWSYLRYLGEIFMPGYVYGMSFKFFFESPEDYYPLQEEIGDTIRGVHLSNSIPPDLKLPTTIGVSGYLIPKKLIPTT
jgi:hypothetical protein